MKRPPPFSNCQCRRWLIMVLSTCLALLSASLQQAAAQSTFTTAAGNVLWGTSSNWSPSGVPNGVDVSVIFLTPLGNQVLTSLGATRTIGSISMTNNSTNTFTTTTTSDLIFDVSSGNASFSVAGTGNVTTTFGSGMGMTLNDNLALSVTNTATTSVDGALRINGVISGAGRIFKSGDGTATLTGTNTYTGGVTIQQGTLRITGSTGVGALPGAYVADQVLINGGTLEYGSASDTTSGANRGFSVGSSGGTIKVTNAGVTYGISAIIADVAGQAGSLTKTGDGILNLSGSNSFTGSLKILGGTVRISSSTGLGALPAALVADQVVLNGGTLDYSTTSNSTSNATRGFSLGNSGGTFSASSTGTFTISGPIADVAGQSGALVKTGTGTLTLSNPQATPSTYTGGTIIASGTLNVGVTGSLGAATGAVKIGSVGGGDASLINYLGGWSFGQNIEAVAGSGGTLTLGYTAAVSFSSTFSGNITLNDNLTLRSDSLDTFALRLTGSISGSRNLTKIGTGTVRLESNNTGYSGTTTITAGTLQLGASGTTATTGGIGTGDIINNGALRLNRSNALTLTNTISGSGMLTQTGAGTTSLSAANSYSGGTTISAGTLLATNTTGSATGTGPISISSASFLGGTGIIAPALLNGVTIAGTLAPGISGINDGVGTLTFRPMDGNVAMAAGSSLVFDLHSVSSYDRLVFGSLGAGELQFGSMSPGSIVVNFANYTPALNDQFDLIDWSALTGSGVSGLSASLLATLPTTGFQAGWIWDTSQFATSGVISITAAAVPEPSRVILLGLGMALMFYRRRR